MPKEGDPLYKTQLCKNFISGKCKYGKRCTFAHGEKGLRKSPRREKKRSKRRGPTPLTFGNLAVLKRVVESPRVTRRSNSPSNESSSSNSSNNDIIIDLEESEESVSEHEYDNVTTVKISLSADSDPFEQVGELDPVAPEFKPRGLNIYAFSFRPLNACAPEFHPITVTCP